MVIIVANTIGAVVDAAVDGKETYLPLLLKAYTKVIM